MNRARTTALAGAAAALSVAFFAGSVTGDDGTSEPAPRIAGDFGTTIPQRAEPATAGGLPAAGSPDEGAIAAGGSGKRRAPEVLHGTGQPVAIAAGEASTISLRCPRRFPVPVSAGLQSSIPGIFPGLITRDPEISRAMLVGAANQTAEEGQWTATIVCVRGVKEA